MNPMKIKPRDNCRWDLVSLGEVMLRLDPGNSRVSTTREFRAWEGGGEYNVARGLRRCFGMNTAIVTALADNPVGRLIADLMLQGGVDLSHVRWVEYDGVGRTVRNGLNFTERGFGVRAALGCSDRGHTAISQLKPGDIDWEKIFVNEGARWFHTGGIFCALSETTPQVAREAMEAAKRTGTVVSYDLNYRGSLWSSIGGKSKAQEVNRSLAPFVDVMLGNAVAYCNGNFYEARRRENLEIFDRVGGGDSFASGLIYGFLTGRDPQWAVDCGAAHGALAMTTPGDTSMATLQEVLQVMEGHSPRIAR